MEFLVLKEIKAKYENSHFSLNIPHLSVKQGEFLGLLGPSGCGKSTLLSVIGGLHGHHEGQIFLKEKDITGLPAEKRNFSMVFQQPLLFPHMSAVDNVAFPLKIRGVSKKERHKRASQILEKVGLNHMDKRFPHELSGGQQQRVALSRAIVHNPELILMDEPFSALDPQLRHSMRQLVKSLHKELETTIVFVTHHLDEASVLFEEVALLSDGQILQKDTPQNLFSKPKNGKAARFLGFENVYKGSFKGKNFFLRNTNFSFEGAPSHATEVVIPNSALSRVSSNEPGQMIVFSVLETTLIQSMIHWKLETNNFILSFLEPIQNVDLSSNSLCLFISYEKLIYF